MSQAAAPAPDAGKKKKGKGKLLVILAATLVLALGGGGAAWFFMARADAANAARQKTAGDHGAGHANGEAVEEEAADRWFGTLLDDFGAARKRLLHGNRVDQRPAFFECQRSKLLEALD